MPLNGSDNEVESRALDSDDGDCSGLRTQPPVVRGDREKVLASGMLHQPCNTSPGGVQARVVQDLRQQIWRHRPCCIQCLNRLPFSMLQLRDQCLLHLQQQVAEWQRHRPAVRWHVWAAATRAAAMPLDATAGPDAAAAAGPAATQIRPPATVRQPAVSAAGSAASAVLLSAFASSAARRARPGVPVGPCWRSVLLRRRQLCCKRLGVPRRHLVFATRRLPFLPSRMPAFQRLRQLWCWQLGGLRRQLMMTCATWRPAAAPPAGSWLPRPQPALGCALLMLLPPFGLLARVL